MESKCRWPLSVDIIIVALNPRQLTILLRESKSCPVSLTRYVNLWHYVTSQYHHHQTAQWTRCLQLCNARAAPPRDGGTA